MIAKWDLLSLPSSFTDLPPLLVNFHFGSTGYTVLLTDLTHIWSETLDRRDVIRRAFQEDTSIDPSEDSHQFQILLDKVQAALTGRDGSILELRHPEDRKLVLRVSSPLPAPLRQLQWPLFLSPAHPTLLTNDFIVPLMERYAQQLRRVESLLGHVKEKDHVITKLVDKLESSGVEVSSVFLNAASLKSSKKASSWDLAGKVVKGLGPFSEQEWMRGLESSRLPELDVDGILQAVFATLPFESGQRQELGKKAEATQDWWANVNHKLVPAVDDASPAVSRNEPTHGSAEPTQKADVDSDATEDSDTEFQRQTTPPLLKDSKENNIASSPTSIHHEPETTMNKIGDLDDETTDEDGHSGTLVTSERATRKHPIDRRVRQGSSSKTDSRNMRPDTSKSSSPKKLGTIGGKKKPDATGRGTDSDVELKLSAREQAADISHESDKQPHKEQNSRSGEQVPPENISTHPPRAAHKLGKIGGSKAPLKTGSIQDIEQLQDVVEDEQSRSKGEGVHLPDHTKSPSRLVRPLARAPNEQLPAAPPESSQDAADQRRAELKRQLELKSMAPAKKKKRIF
ncbi:MAG: hypothetical protein M1816_002605 [Peltula sp. TS41687]|nr:MAG: hypothetical protein M1816_002605 [Peltula sp. TS41687]